MRTSEKKGGGGIWEPLSASARSPPFLAHLHLFFSVAHVQSAMTTLVSETKWWEAGGRLAGVCCAVCVCGRESTPALG